VREARFDAQHHHAATAANPPSTICPGETISAAAGESTAQQTQQAYQPHTNCDLLNFFRSNPFQTLGLLRSISKWLISPGKRAIEAITGF
jgi:hypothetical protein